MKCTKQTCQCETVEKKGNSVNSRCIQNNISTCGTLGNDKHLHEDDAVTKSVKRKISTVTSGPFEKNDERSSAIRKKISVFGRSQNPSEGESITKPVKQGVFPVSSDLREDHEHRTLEV